MNSKVPFPAIQDKCHLLLSSADFLWKLTLYNIYILSVDGLDVCLFDLILYVPSTIFQSCRDRS